MDYISQLPMDLFAPIIFLSVDALVPGNRIIRTEELRLVSRAWQVAIDSSPCFWTWIPYLSKRRFSPQEIQRWIKKSGEAPLHILFDSYFLPHREFMPLVIPYAHRWQSLSLNGRYSNISKYLNEPAPLLRSLFISEAFLISDNVAFGGVTPSLSSVDLADVTIAADLSFLKNLKELRLNHVTYQPGEAAINKLWDVLNACPELEQLQLDTNQSLCQPVLLSKLLSFSLTGSQESFERTEAILGMITAPRLLHSSLELTSSLVPQNLRVLSPLSSELLRHHGEYDITINRIHFYLSTTSREGGLQPPSSVTAYIWGVAEACEIPLKLLQDFEKAAPPSASVDLVLDESRPALRVLQYLKPTNDSTSGISDNPLPQLRSIKLTPVGCKLGSSLDIELINLARARRNTPKITIHELRDDGFALVSQLDPESFSFVPVG